MRARLQSAVATASRHTRAGAKRGKHGIVYFITSDKVIQAVMTASAFAVVAAAVEAIAVFGAAAVGQLAVPPLKLVLFAGIFYVAMWADDNTAAWRELVEEKTGEEPADD